jgi:hypothetical protein
MRFRDGGREKKVQREKEKKDRPETVRTQKERKMELLNCG